MNIISNYPKNGRKAGIFSFVDKPDVFQPGAAITQKLEIAV
jgi:hypothetical protein